MRFIRGYILVIFSFLLLVPRTSYGLMSSTNFTIFADSIDVGGILNTTSVYTLEDSVGESPVGFTTSSVYEVRGGYQAMDWSQISMTISTSSIDLGQLSTSEVASSTSIVSITTESEAGYVLSVSSISGTGLTGVSDGTVTAGQEEYGIAVTGIDVAFADDRAMAASLVISSSSTPVTSAQTTVNFKAAISASSAAGSYSQSVILTASANL